MSERILEINRVELCVESFGEPDRPCLLLIMGAMASMVWWDRRLCQRLADLGLHVLRYDNRDVGRSTCYPPGPPAYSVDDMVDDALGVLDAHGVDRAHWCGMSLGGMLAQIAGLRHPARVASITAIASGIFDDRPDLPGIDPAVLAYHARGAEVDWQDETSVVDYQVGGWKVIAGTRHPFDPDRVADLARQEFRRARSLTSMFNHAQLKGGEDLYGRVPELRLPVLVVHGTLDPVLPLPHARALADAIPGARLIALDGGGHELHPDDWDIVVGAIAELIRQPRSESCT